MNHTIAQQRALAAHNAEVRKQEERDRIARLERVKKRLIRRFVRERSGWLLAAASIGAALAVVLLRVST